MAGARAALSWIPPVDSLYFVAGLQGLAWYLSHTNERADLEEALAS